MRHEKKFNWRSRGRGKEGLGDGAGRREAPERGQEGDVSVGNQQLRLPGQETAGAGDCVRHTLCKANCSPGQQPWALDFHMKGARDRSSARAGARKARDGDWKVMMKPRSDGLKSKRHQKKESHCAFSFSLPHRGL